MTYIRQLDSLRAIAVILVVVGHWLPKRTTLLFPLGGIGVDIFFVISGFLITSILLLKKVSIERNAGSEMKIQAIGKFIMRRFLRIFPIYYLLLLMLYFGALYLPNPIPFDWEYYVLYVQNFLFYARQSLPGGKVSPLWSLAVEEQFYLVWPWLLFFVPSKYIGRVLIGGITLGLLSTLIFPIVLAKKGFTNILTPTCLQAFCLGGCLAYATVYIPNILSDGFSRMKIAGIVSLVLFIVFKLLFANVDFLDRTLIAISTTWIICAIVLDKLGPFGFLFNNYFLIQVRKVSYGIYLYHNFVPISVKMVMHRLIKDSGSGISQQFVQMMEPHTLLFHCVCTIILLVVAFSSYYFIERPILGLKKYFE